MEPHGDYCDLEGRFSPLRGAAALILQLGSRIRYHVTVIVLVTEWLGTFQTKGGPSVTTKSPLRLYLGLQLLTTVLEILDISDDRN